MNPPPLKDIWIRRNLGIGILLLTLLFGALITSLIPVEYTARAIVGLKTEADEIQNIITEETAIIRSQTVINDIITRLKLDKSPEFNIELDVNRALSTKLIDAMQAYLQANDRAVLTLNDKIYKEINQNLTLIFTHDSKVHIHYTSPSPHLARAIANLIAQTYSKTPNPRLSKTVLKKSAYPKSFSTPDIKYALYCSLLSGLLLGILGNLFIRPRTEAIIRKNG